MDAAIAALALAVVYPQAGNLAGGGFLVVRTPDGTVQALDFRETAPARASRDMFLGPGGRPVPEASTATALAVATPGSVRGYAEAHRRLGRLPLGKGRGPGGTPRPRGVRRSRPDSRKTSPRSASCLVPGGRKHADLFPGGLPLAAGVLFRQPVLAETLARIAKEGPEAFHRGDMAARIVTFVRAHGGVLSEEDLAGYAPLWRAPDTIRFGPLVVHTMPLPSSAGLVLRSVLGQLEVARGAAQGPRRELHPPSPRGRAASLRRPQSLARGRRLLRRPARRAPRAGSSRRSRGIDRRGAGDSLRVRGELSFRARRGRRKRRRTSRSRPRTDSPSP